MPPTPPALSDDILFHDLLAEPFALDEGLVFFADGATLPGNRGRHRISLGWRQHGGAVILGLVAGEATAELLLESLQLAAATRDWTLDRWGLVFEEFWERAPDRLRAAVLERWPLPERGGWSLTIWCEAVWGKPPTPGPTSAGLLALDVPGPVRRAVDFIGASRTVAAFVVDSREQEAGRVFVRAHRVAGGWEPGPIRPLPGRWQPKPSRVAAGARKEERERGREERNDALAAVARACREAGAAATWFGRDWVKFRGAAGSVRIFPRAGRGVDIQLAGADEGTLAGLRYRYGVALAGTPAPGSTAAHLRLDGPVDLTAAVTKLLQEWLANGPG